MKIAYLFGSLNRGGMETLFLDVFRNADKASFEMIGIHRKGGIYEEEFCATGQKMIRCAPKKLGYLRYLMQLRNILLSEGISIVHAQHWVDCIYAGLATIGTNIRVVNTFHGFYSPKGLLGLLRRMSIYMADMVCFVSQYEADWYKFHYHMADKRCRVIYNGVDFSKMELEKVETSELESTGGVRLCMVGNFMNGRDHITLIRALQLLHQKGNMFFDFYFIGKRVEEQAEIYDECKRICDVNKMKHVHFLGGRGDVPTLLKLMDGFVYSTDHDTFGIAIVEAMAAGLPVVVNDWPVMQEVCGNMAIYFRSKDVEDCAIAIEKLLSDLPQRKETAKKNAALVRDRYSIEAYLARLSAVYDITNERVNE